MKPASSPVTPVRYSALVLACLLVLLALAVPFILSPRALAQTDTTSGLGGTVSAEDSREAVAGARVSLRLAATGVSLETRANAVGQYFFAGLRADEGYLLVASAPGYDSQTIGPFGLSPGEQRQQDIVLADPTKAKGGIVQMERFVVTTEREQPPPGTSSGLSGLEIEERPSGDATTINDFATSDPRITMLNMDTGEIAAAGQNVRFNSIQIDGMRIDDMFGLFDNGLPSQGNPFSMETVQFVSVDLAPYDVTRGGFTGASINAVTKSGGNYYFGSAYYSYRNERFYAPNRVTGTRTPFTSQNYGFTLGGPMIKNRLFFFISWEHSNYTNPAREAGYAPGGDALAQIVAIARNQYGFDAGELIDIGARSRASDRYMAKVDWAINEQHRLTLTYNGSHGSQPVFADYGGVSTTSLSSHWYLSYRGLDALSAQLVSKWTDALQTQLSASRQHIVADATPGSEWPEEIASHLNGTSAVLLFVSSNSMDSHNVRREVTFGINLR
jgi:hypothetical protein